VYRTSARTTTPDAAVVCRACGARFEVAFGDARHGTVTCTRCDAVQPALRDADDLDAKSLELVNQVSSDAYDELVPLMRALDVEGKAAQVSIACDGIHVVVSLELDSGAVKGLELAAAAPGLVDLRLVREDEAHRDAKARGIARECQTGDGAFDAAVYVESKTRDADLQIVLAPPAVRAAVMKLLSVADRVEVQSGSVKVSFPKDAGAFDPATILERVSLVRVVAGAPRPLAPVDAPVSLAASVARVGTYLLAPLGLGAIVLGNVRYAPIDTRPYVFGVVIGLVLALAVHPLFRRALRGRSTSHKEILLARAATLVWLPCFTTGALFIYNGAADRSAERVVTLTVISSEVDEDDARELHVKTKDPEGATHEHTLHGWPTQSPTHISVRWRDGALGWTWQSGSPSALP
jgi:hypothetical protein